MVARGAASEEFTALSSGCPEALSDSVVTAAPVVAPNGKILAVIALYAAPTTVVPEQLLTELRAQAAEAGRRIAGARGLRDRESLLEHADFLASLVREVDAAQAAGAGLWMVAMAGEPANGQSSLDEWLWVASRELRVAGEGRGHVLERREAGEILAVFPSDVELQARECVHLLCRAAQTDSGTSDWPVTLRVAVGSASLPEDAGDAHALISVAAMRLDEARRVEPAVDTRPALPIPA